MRDNLSIMKKADLVAKFIQMEIYILEITVKIKSMEKEYFFGIVFVSLIFKKIIKI